MNLVRFQAILPSRSGQFPGVFALVNRLGLEERLSTSERRWWRENNEWFESHLTDPFKANPTLQDRALHPDTSSWFRFEAIAFVDRTMGYLDILTKHSVPWVELRSDSPGTVLFDDDNQQLVAGSHDPTRLGRSIEVHQRFDPTGHLP